MVGTPDGTPSDFPSVVRVHPGRLAGRLRVPGDKSQSHRSLIFGALAEGNVDVTGVQASGDVLATAQALRSLGVDVQLHDEGDGNMGGTVSGTLGEADDVIDCGNSGTGMRLLAGAVAGIDGVSVLTGDGSLRSRPMDRVALPLRAMGVSVDGRDGGRRPPIVIRGGAVRAVDWVSSVASGQVKSCIMLAGLSADGPSTITSPLVSRDHTERMLRHLGVDVTTEVREDGTEHVRIVPGPVTAAPIAVSGDPSSAAFWFAAAGPAGGQAITITDLCVNPTRTGAIEALRRMGADVVFADQREVTGDAVASVTVFASELQGVRLDGRAVVDAIDELPVLAIVGAVGGGLEVRDAAELRVKESDRISAMARLCAAVGLDLVEHPDGFDVPGGQTPGPGTVDAGGDHRIAMTAAIAATLGSGVVEIHGCASVATSYPGFFDDLVRLGGTVEVVRRLADER